MISIKLMKPKITRIAIIVELVRKPRMIFFFRDIVIYIITNDWKRKRMNYQMRRSIKKEFSRAV